MGSQYKYRATLYMPKKNLSIPFFGCCLRNGTGTLLLGACPRLRNGTGTAADGGASPLASRPASPASLALHASRFTLHGLSRWY